MKSHGKPMKCPYCGGTAILRPATYVYGDAALEEYLYVCQHYPACDAYVSVHRGTKVPKGTLANGDLRNMRIKAHQAFDSIWKNNILSKHDAYKWLQDKFCLRPDQAHIGLFSEYMCRQVIDESKKVLENNRNRRQIVA